MIFTNSLTSVKNKVVAIDIDGTLCTEEKTFERSFAKPLNGAVEAVSLLYRNNNTIILYSARGWEQYNLTKSWLDQHGFVYHQLILGKPIADLWIDDRARQFTSWDLQLI